MISGNETSSDHSGGSDGVATHSTNRSAKKLYISYVATQSSPEKSLENSTLGEFSRRKFIRNLSLLLFPGHLLPAQQLGILQYLELTKPTGVRPPTDPDPLKPMLFASAYGPSLYDDVENNKRVLKALSELYQLAAKSQDIGADLPGLELRAKAIIKGGEQIDPAAFYGMMAIVTTPGMSRETARYVGLGLSTAGALTIWNPPLAAGLSVAGIWAEDGLTYLTDVGNYSPLLATTPCRESPASTHGT